MNVLKKLSLIQISITSFPSNSWVSDYFVSYPIKLFRTGNLSISNLNEKQSFPKNRMETEHLSVKYLIYVGMLCIKIFSCWPKNKQKSFVCFSNGNAIIFIWWFDMKFLQTRVDSICKVVESSWWLKDLVFYAAAWTIYAQIGPRSKLSIAEAWAPCANKMTKVPN